MPAHFTKILLFSFIILITRCTIPRYTTNLQDILKEELGEDKKVMSKYRCTTGAHRGSSVIYTENTASALLAAEQDPAYAFIEFDVQFTKDKKIVVFHDRRLLRLYGKFNSINNSTYEELALMTDGNITLYDEVIEKLHKNLNIEIKSQGNKEEDRQLADEILSDIFRRKREKEVMISSISPDVISYVNEKYPSIPTGQIHWLTLSTFLHVDALTNDLYEELNETQADYLMLHVSNLANIEILLALKPKDKTIIFWNFDDRMFLVHKDPADRLWGSSLLQETWKSFLFWTR
ncbi:MAG: hypothetical protein JXQ65_13110 [Candidatus Marinimicrobia bacterium]|nr:hypothetical protein [Candidatus Neomarinimicrobiota bacterium]